MNELSRSIQELPLAGLVPVALAVVVGLLLWGAGRRLIRPGFAAAGLLIGLALGWIIGENINLGVPAFVPALVAGVGLAAVAALTYRLAVAGALAIVLGVGGPMAVVAVGELQHKESSQTQEAVDAPADGALTDLGTPPAEEDAFDRWLREKAREHLPGLVAEDLTTEELAQQLGFSEHASQHMDTVKSWAQAVYAAAKQYWDDLPEHLRPAVLGAAGTGALAGLLIGALIPGLSASIVTAFGGGLLWLTGGRIIAEHLSGHAVLPATGRGWLVLWIAISLIGLVIQWIFRPKRADS